MPINFVDYSDVEEGDKGKNLDCLCESEWEMPAQIEALEQWLKLNKNKLPKGSYVANIGFSPRPSASGGGAVLTTESMEIMVSLGMKLFLSEYPEFVDEKQT